MHPFLAPSTLWKKFISPSHHLLIVPDTEWMTITSNLTAEYTPLIVSWSTSGKISQVNLKHLVRATATFFMFIEILWSRSTGRLETPYLRRWDMDSKMMETGADTSLIRHKNPRKSCICVVIFTEIFCSVPWQDIFIWIYDKRRPVGSPSL